MTQRVIVSVLLLLFCGSGAAEPTNKTVAIHAAAVPKDVKTTPAPSGPAKSALRCRHLTGAAC